ncbi:MAG TPA: DNA-directed RNA polymerase subunit omega [bacterium]|nr:DNA-directed RNA polymerase subunit omega [bacterium]HNT65218.1 DNA-directed RNA polymerase subunit omega [bacterium]
MISTIPLQELEKNAGSIYEAIVIIAKRANQINAAQKKMIEAETAAVETDNDDYDDEVVSADLIDRQYLKLPKPTAIALQEMLEGKLQSIDRRDQGAQDEQK